jgi:DnaJ-class molecular chaperone
MTAALRLSHREAFDGVTVPLDVPVRAACPLCGGRGESWMERCRACMGTGNSLFHHRVRLAVPAGVADGARFAFRVTAPLAVPTRVEVVVEIF